MAKFIHQEVSQRFPASAYKSIGAFLFLRFFCPALVAPHSYGLTQDTPSEVLQRELVLLSKIMQNFANNIGKQPLACNQRS